MLFTEEKKGLGYSYSKGLVICFKDEISNLRTHFNAWSDQENKFDEMVFIDDFSKDESVSFIHSVAVSNPKIKMFQAEKDIPGKKLALLQGLKKSSSDLIFLTDADCTPGPQWTSSMLKELSAQTEIILGFSPYEKTKGILNTWIRYEAVITAFQYLNLAILKMPYMGVGRNLVYRKESFLKKQNLESHLDIPSGDDDLLISKMANKNNTAVCLNKDAFVYSKAAPNFSVYSKQKKRHYSTAHRYKLKHKLLLGLFSSSQIIFYLGIIFSAIFLSPKIALTAYFARLILAWIANYFLCKKLDQADLIIYWPVLDIILTLYYLYFSISVLIPTKSTWT